MPRKPTPTTTPTAGSGHNSLDKDRLRSLVERVENLEQEKAELTSDIRDVYREAKGQGFDVRAIRTIIKLRKQDQTERREREDLVAEYMAALGDYASTPLGASAVARASAGLMPPV
jgi:uncharacterized protein (UPF0335 family)